ncbi:MAG TPA: biotin/lipoyl-containing protein, partial [Rhizomicrobium sp.]
MPALSPTMEEGKLAKWLVKEGQAVKSGDILAEIETDKATMEFEAVDEGRIGKLLVPEGTEGVKVNAPIATLLEDGENADAKVDIASAMQSIKSAVTEAAPKPAAPSAPPPVPETVKAVSTLAHGDDGSHHLFASPLARRIAAQKGLDLAAVAGSG